MTFQTIGNAVGILRPGFSLVEQITNDLSTTPEIDVEGRSFALVRSPNSSVTSVSLFASGTEGGLYTQVTHEVDGEVEDVVIALSGAKSVPIPVVFAACRYVKLVGNAAGQIEIFGI